MTSDTFKLVNACIARVRATAGLDDDVVLPPLPRPTRPRDVAVLTRSQAEAAAAAARTAAGARAAELALAPIPRAGGPGQWLLRLCALIVVATGTAAFVASPAGHRAGPRTQAMTDAARAHATTAVKAVIELIPE